MKTLTTILKELSIIRKELQAIRGSLEPYKDYKYVRENGRVIRKRI